MPQLRRRDGLSGGKTYHIAPEFDRGAESDISEWCEQHYSIRFRNHPVSEDYMHDAEQVTCV